MCFEFYFSLVCRTQKFPIFYQILIKRKFVCKIFFSLVHSKRDIFLSSMNFSLNYQRQNFIYAFVKKMTVEYLFE